MKVLVTGGGGFLGGALVRALLARGDRVVTMQRGHYPDLQATGAEVHQGDLCELDLLQKAAIGCDLVLHVAGKTGVWGAYQDYYHCNVKATQAVIEACLANRIERLVYTSTPSVVFSGRDEDCINETSPYPDRFLNHYQSTKAEAEQLVLAANSSLLATLALRPHLIWGPGDPHLVRRVMERAQAGKLRLVKTDKLVDTTYIDNAVAAHLLAGDALRPGASCAGKAYFISNGTPLPLHVVINQMLEAHGLAPVQAFISPSLAILAGTFSELLYRLLGIKQEPLLTRFVARQLSCAHWYDLSAARRDLGYHPTVSHHEGLARLKQSAA